MGSAEVLTQFTAHRKPEATAAPEVKGESPEPEQKQQTARLRCVNAFELLSLNIPQREMLLSPILPRQGLAMVHAARGIGKTFISLSVAYAVASGGKVFDRWGAPNPARVLFIDGEMPARTLQERLAAIVAGNDVEPPEPDYLRILTPDLQDNSMPNIATREGQEAVASFLKGVDLIILDNLATLASHGRSNDEESWKPVQGWLLELRRRGMAVLLIHHAGKGGDQRGTSAKEDILDTVIRLARPKDYNPEQGARFEVHLTKARGISGPELKPFEAQLLTAGHALSWATRDIEDVELEHLAALIAEGCTIRDAAEEMGISKSAAGRLKKRLDARRADARISQGTTFSSLGGDYERQ
jgi:putative DNA primase/helicase